MTRHSDWADILKEEIDDKIGEIMSTHKASYDLCAANVIAEVIRDAELQDEWDKQLRLQKRFDEITRERDVVKGRLERVKGTISRELGLPYWSSDADISLARTIENGNDVRIMNRFMSLPEGEEIAELRKVRSGIDRKLEIASLDKRLVPAIRQICEAVGIEIDGLEG